MTDNRLCIGIPSNRKLPACESSIRSAVTFCQENDIPLFVSDNSGDAEKKQALSALVTGEGMSYVACPPSNIFDNWFSAFNGTEGDFVLMMGDDDKVFNMGAMPDLGDLDDSVVGIRPTIIAYIEPRGITNINFSAIKSDKPIERIVEHVKSSNGSNIGICSFWRRDILKSIMELHFYAHPTKGMYCDWALMNGLVSSGKVIKNPMSCYFYDVHNWMGDADFVQSQLGKAFESSGLPASAAVYATVLNAIDSFIYVARKDSPLSKEDRTAAGLFCLSMLLENYAQRIPSTSAHPNAKAISALSHKLIGNKNTASLFDIALGIIGEMQGGLADKYKLFFEEATGYAFGKIV